MRPRRQNARRLPECRPWGVEEFSGLRVQGVPGIRRPYRPTMFHQKVWRVEGLEFGLPRFVVHGSVYGAPDSAFCVCAWTLRCRPGNIGTYMVGFSIITIIEWAPILIITASLLGLPATLRAIPEAPSGVLVPF